MKKFFKTLVLMLFLTVTVLSLTACGGGQPASPNNNNNNNNPPLTTDPYKDYVINKDGNYVYFGLYPTSVKAANVSVSEEADENGYYKGSDGYLYAKYSFNLNGTYGNDDYSLRKFSDGTTFDVNKDYERYFKLDKLKWRILKQESGKALLICDSVIDQLTFQPYRTEGDIKVKKYINFNHAEMPSEYKEFAEAVDEADTSKTKEKAYASDWAYSYARYFLNYAENGFFNTAFSAAQKALIVESTIKNDISTTNTLDGNSTNGDETDPYVYLDTLDNVFLLSWKEFQNTEYGYGDLEDSTNRILKNTDYAIARGSYNHKAGDEAFACYLTRSWSRVNVNNSKGNSIYVTDQGQLVGIDVSYDLNGMAPALWVTLAD